jgi:hypothetical protein
MKTWQKVAVGVLTIGVTGTAIYFGYKAIQKHLDKKKKEKDGSAPVPKVDVKKVPARKPQLISSIQHELKNNKMDVFKDVPDKDFEKLSEQELSQLNDLLKKYSAAGGETTFKKQDPKGFTTMLALMGKVTGLKIKGS